MSKLQKIKKIVEDIKAVDYFCADIKDAEVSAKTFIAFIIYVEEKCNEILSLINNEK